MLKKHMAACLVVTAFAAAPALAQTSSPSAPTDRPAASGSGSTTTGSPAMQPGASGSSSAGQSSTTMGQNSAMQGQFMTKMEMNHVMASDLIGTRVVSANNESIGDINDVILDRNGQIMAAVVGVGGFLGIGEKDVAVPFKSLEFMSSQQAQAMDSTNSGNSGASGNVTTTGSTATTGNTATSGTGGSAGATNTAANTSSGNQNQPERVVLRMTKAELQAAPAFDEDGDNNANRSTTGTTGTTGTTTAPKQ